MIERDRIIENAQLDAAIVLKQQLIEEMKHAKEEQDDEGMSLGAYATSWLRGRWSSLGPATRERYTGELDDHILPELGDMPMTELRAEDIARWRDRKHACGKASATVNSYLRCLKAITANAYRAGLIARDPSLDVKALPEDDARINDDEPNALTPAELGEFLRAARLHQPTHYPMILTLAMTGMRMSAVRALRWEDVDDACGVITVRRRVSGKAVVPGVKRSRRSKDVVPLLPELASVLDKHRRSMTAMQLAAGWVFPTADGNTRTGSVLRKPFKVILEKAKITKRFTPHGLRRTANDLYRRVSSEVVTKAITGHVTQRMHEHYSTVTADEKIAAARRAFGEVLQSGGGSGGPSADERPTIH